MVDRDPIEQLIAKWRAEVADMRSRHGGQAVPRVLELCADELDALAS